MKKPSKDAMKTAKGQHADASKPAPRRRIPRALSRRALLKGGAGRRRRAAVARADAAARHPRAIRRSTPPKRFGIFFSPCGTIPENWRSTLGDSRMDTDFTLSPILQPLQPFKDKLVVLRGMNFESSTRSARSRTCTTRG